MDMEDYGEIPATPGGAESPMHEYNPEVQDSDVNEYNPEMPDLDDDAEYNPDVSANMEESEGEGGEGHGLYGNEAGSHRSGHSSPAYSLKSLHSQPGSPVGSEGPHSPTGSDGPASPAGSDGPASPAGSGDGPSSPYVGEVGSPIGSRPSSPAENGPHSPAGSEPCSPAGSGPHSPVGSGPRSPAESEPRSPPGSGPQSPVGSELQSPAGSGPRSPAGSELRSPVGSEPRSPAGSEPRSPAGSEPRSPAGSEPRSPVGSEPRSPAGSEPRSPRGSEGAVSPARISRSRSRSPEADVRSRSGSRGSDAGSRHSSPISKRHTERNANLDSEDEEEEAIIPKSKSNQRRRRIKGSDESDNSDNEEPMKVLPSDSEDERPGTPRGAKRKAKGSDDEDSDKGSNVGGLINDIFGKSDDEEEFEGFGENDVTSYSKKDRKQSGFGSDDDEGGRPGDSILPEVSSDEEGGSRHRREDFVSDFDLMLERKKAEMARTRRKRKDGELLNDSDDIIEDMIKRMKEAAEADRELNKQKKPAVKVLCMLPLVKRNLMKVELHPAMIDGGILSAITEWLAPLPDKSLPHLEVRESLLKQLLEFAQISTEGLKMSGLGKAVMYLFKHPRETRTNKEMANRLINEWARPIFSHTADYRGLSKEEREQRDIEQLPKKRRISLEGGATPHRDIGKALSGEEKVLRPGDPGYVYRARVPQLSNRDYVIRPKWNVEEKMHISSKKKGSTKLDKYMRQGKKGKGQTFQSAVKISIEGRNMAL